MGKKRIILIATLLSATLIFLTGARSDIKQLLPRNGKVEVVGGVYTPFLQKDSFLYALKTIDEGIDLFLAQKYTDKAKIELTIANKRLLEIEKLNRDKKNSFVPFLAKSFDTALESSITFSRLAIKQNEDTEELTWALQESYQDYQDITKKIIGGLPEKDKGDFELISKKNSAEIIKLLKELYGLEE